MKLNGKIAAVTGAGSGIGRAVALRLAEEGCSLAISDINETALEETRLAVVERKARVTAQRLDVADRDAVEAWAARIVQDHGSVDVIINNAGVALGATVEGMDYADFEWLMNINFWGVVYGTKAFLPLLKQQEEACIVNVSSVFGFIGIPTQSAYNAAKFAVKGFTEALQQELWLENSPVRAICVHPGGIRTNIVHNSRMGELDKMARPKDKAAAEFDKIARTSPAEAAAVIVRGIKRDQPRVLIGADAHFIDWTHRIWPNLHKKVVSFLSKKSRSDDPGKKDKDTVVPV